jgi:hypothetical protein
MPRRLSFELLLEALLPVSIHFIFCSSCCSVSFLFIFHVILFFLCLAALFVFLYLFVLLVVVSLFFGNLILP